MGRGLGRVRPPPTTCRVPSGKRPSIAANPFRRRSRVNESGLVRRSDSRVNKLCWGPGGRAQQRRPDPGLFSLHIVSISSTFVSESSRSRRTSPRGCLRRWGECGSRGRDDTSRSRAASGRRPAGIMTGLRLGRWTGTGGGRQHLLFSRVPGSALELSGGVGSPPQVPRRNAGR